MAQINKIRNERGEVSTNTTEMQNIIRDSCENHTPTNWTPRKNGYISRNIQPSETEPGRNRKYEQTNHKH